MCIRDRDSAYVFKTLVKAIELASTKGKVIIGLETQIDSDMDGLDIVVRAVSYTHLEVYKRQI